MHIAYDNMSKALTLYANICKAIFFIFTTYIITSVVVARRLILLSSNNNNNSLVLAINLCGVIIFFFLVVLVVVVVDPIHDAHCKLITFTTSFIPYHKTRNCIHQYF